jgi:hypothetical protein
VTATPDDGTDLLALTCSAHGGWERWQSISRISADLSIGGALWASKGHDGVLADAHVSIRTDRQVVIFEGFGPDRVRSLFEPGRVTLQGGQGTVRGTISDIRRSFPADQTVPWVDLQVAYFASNALWNYLTLPFLLATPGIRTSEVSGWPGADPTWRRLRAEFSGPVETHNRVQYYNIDDTGRLVRHDYDAEVLGEPPAVNTASRYVEHGGIVFPTRRRVTPRDHDGAAVAEPLLVSIDFGDIDAR